ncbi:MAG: secondary thiamine-phosphate synthase enzyme YjbQ [bacterium]|nr:secondary thiamine-phosphate synthase enzyme YjbQ [bacterium]
MRTHKELLWFSTEKRCEIIDITSKIERAVARSGVTEGLVLVYPMHTSSAVYVSDSDRSLTRDLDALLTRLAPQAAGYHHDKTDPKENAEAHLRAILCGHHIVLPVAAAQLDLGTYQTIYYAEFDGIRKKEIQVKVLGDAVFTE